MNCPICNRPTDKAYRPFCSPHCADIDLSRWLNEDYAIPASDEDDATAPDTADSDKDNRRHGPH